MRTKPDLTSSLLILLSLGVAACSGSGAMTSEEFSDAQPEPDALTIPGLGDSCATGCAGAAMCANQSDDCDTGYCLFDSRDDDNWQSYCTVDCTQTPCPEAYSCLDIAFSLERACVADPAVCGDDIVQIGEQCDDGNTASDDGCRGDCQALDTPLAEQQRLILGTTISGMHIPPGADVAEPFSIVLDVDEQANGAGNGCSEPKVYFSPATSTLGDYVQVVSESCGQGGWGRVSFDVLHQEGINVYPRMCVELRLPHPGGSEVEAGGALLGARVTYCRFTQSEGTITVSSAGPDVASDTQRLVGSLDVPGTLVINEAIGGCDGLYGPSDCPTIVGDIEMSGTFELANAPTP